MSLLLRFSFDKDDGKWITVNGSHIHIDKDGKPDKGNPSVIKGIKGDKSKKSGVRIPPPPKATFTDKDKKRLNALMKKAYGTGNVTDSEHREMRELEHRQAVSTFSARTIYTGDKARLKGFSGTKFQEGGKLLPLYHASDSEFTEFELGTKGDMEGVFFSAGIDGIAEMNHRKFGYRCFANVKKPLIAASAEGGRYVWEFDKYKRYRDMEAKRDWDGMARFVRDKCKELGYDAIIYTARRPRSGLYDFGEYKNVSQIVVLDPKDIFIDAIGRIK